jgi:hypothetical protein
MAPFGTSGTIARKEPSEFCRYATVIPIYKQSPSGTEARRISVSIRTAQPDSVYFVGPVGLDPSPYLSQWPTAEFIGFDSENFGDVGSYNRWMLTPDLYRRLASYEFVLVCQADAILTKLLPVDEPWDFDYLGAPWTPPWVLGWDPFRKRLTKGRTGFRKRALAVGNGGLSLRRTAAFSRELPLPHFQEMENEDVIISYFSNRLGIRLATEDVASRYFMELAAMSWREGDPIPDVYGFHALDKYNPRLEDLVLESAERHHGTQ